MRRLALLAFSMLSLAACNTIAGAGQDLTTAGMTITQETREIQNDL